MDHPGTDWVRVITNLTICIAISQKLKSVLGLIRNIVVLPSHLFQEFEEVEPTPGVDGSD